MLQSILETNQAGVITTGSFLVCTAISVVLGILGSLIYMYQNTYTKGFSVTLAALPLAVQVVITLVNGNLGVGVAVAGAFSLTRFRSAAGGGREIGAIFLAMAIGLATGMGYIGVAILLLAVSGLLQLILLKTSFGSGSGEKELVITIPESLDYQTVFDDLMEKYTNKWEQIKVKTTNMGACYEIRYTVLLKDDKKTKEFLDEIRCRNGNLTVSLGRSSHVREEL